MRARCLLVTLLLSLLLAPVAVAQGIVDRAAEALKTDPVYVGPDAELALEDADADRIRRAIEEKDAGPMYVAVLPDAAEREAGGSARGVVESLQEKLGRSGTYAVVVGRTFQAGSTDVRGTGAQADAALREHGGESPTATLLAFVDRMGQLRAGDAPGDGGGGGGAGLGAAVLLPILALVGGGLLLSRRRRRRRHDADMAELKENVRDDLVALGDDIRALDLDVEMPATSQAAKADYARAVEAYERADAISERARTPQDFEPVGAALEEGRYAMASAKARMEGHPVPQRTPPCFFDPRHGPSDRQVEWTPYGGVPRQVPACEADAQRVERGEEPEAREVLVGGRRTPYWNAGPMYAPFAGGFFGAFGGGLLPGLMMGTMLGGWGMPGAAHGEESSGGGDFGGGDFGGGGGDFGGGGGFGGGDF